MSNNAEFDIGLLGLLHGSFLHQHFPIQMSYCLFLMVQSHVFEFNQIAQNSNLITNNVNRFNGIDL